MTDPLSISASIIATIQLTGTVIAYFEDTKNAAADQKKLLDETKAIQKVLRIKTKIEHLLANYDKEWTESMAELEDPLERLRKSVERLASKLKPASGINKLWKTVSWHARKEGIQEVILSIERYKSLFILAAQNTHMHVFHICLANL